MNAGLTAAPHTQRGGFTPLALGKKTSLSSVIANPASAG
jgi:hypothetical protein